MRFVYNVKQIMKLKTVEKVEQPEECPEERNAPKYFKLKKNGVKFFAIVSILSSIVMFASGICYLSKSDEEKEIKVSKAFLSNF